jgi:hypothetical protein
VLFALADKESYAFALTREAFGWRRIPLAVAEGRRVSPRKPIPALAAPRRYISTMLVAPERLSRRLGAVRADRGRGRPVRNFPLCAAKAGAGIAVASDCRADQP